MAGIHANPGVGLRAEAEMSKYTWIITKDDLRPPDTSSLVFKKGPPGAKDRAPLAEVVQNGENFRLLDESDQPKVSGYITGQYTGFEPLDEYGREIGCTAIEYRRGGTWVSIIT